MILYAPPSSVMVERDFSINAGLPASTATPGRTAPLWSFTIPVSVLWARAPEHAMNTNRQAMEIRFSIPILPPFRQTNGCRIGIRLAPLHFHMVCNSCFVLVYIKACGSSQQTSCYRDLKLDESCISNPKFRNFDFVLVLPIYDLGFLCCD